MTPLELTGTHTDTQGNLIHKVYREGDPLEDLEGKILHAVHGFCFCEGKLVVVFDSHTKRWSVPGGGIDEGETFEEALVREVAEESNMRVVHHELIGYQDMDRPEREKLLRQTRSFCIVEPIGEFVADPAGDVIEVRCIDPREYKEYFDWGEIGERIMTVALEKLARYEENQG